VALHLSQGWQWVYGPAKSVDTLQPAAHTHTSNKMPSKMINNEVRAYDESQIVMQVRTRQKD